MLYLPSEKVCSRVRAPNWVVETILVVICVRHVMALEFVCGFYFSCTLDFQGELQGEPDLRENPRRDSARVLVKSRTRVHIESNIPATGSTIIMAAKQP